MHVYSWGCLPLQLLLLAVVWCTCLRMREPRLRSSQGGLPVRKKTTWQLAVSWMQLAAGQGHRGTRWVSRDRELCRHFARADMEVVWLWLWVPSTFPVSNLLNLVHRNPPGWTLFLALLQAVGDRMGFSMIQNRLIHFHSMVSIRGKSKRISQEKARTSKYF